MLGPILFVVLILMLVGSLPVYRYSSDWGYFPSGILGTVLLMWLILFLVDRGLARERPTTNLVVSGASSSSR